MKTRWRKMKTAPKDGTFILVCCRFVDGGWGMDVTKWQDDGWWQHRQRDPLRWMPLPNPPSNVEGQR